MNDPEFVREREAWFTTGVNLMVLYAALTVVAVGALVGISTLVFDLSTYQIMLTHVVGSCAALAIASQFLNFTARERARRGGVQVDRF